MMPDLALLVAAAAPTFEDQNLVSVGGMAHPAEVAPRQLAALIRIEGQLVEMNAHLAALVEALQVKGTAPKRG